MIYLLIKSIQSLKLSSLQAFWGTCLTMGRPRTKFLDVELPESQKERRKILNRRYNRNRTLTLKLKVFFSLTPSLSEIVEW